MKQRYDKTRFCYRSGAWPAIVNHPEYDLGKRELDALKLFLPQTANLVPGKADVLHLGVGDGREIEHFVSAIPHLGTYVVNDLCGAMLQEVIGQARRRFPDTNFLPCLADIEASDELNRLRGKVPGPALFVLVANGVIFADDQIDEELSGAMRTGDQFLITLETPHEGMLVSYDIEPVFRLLSKDEQINPEEFRVGFNEETSCVEVAKNGQALLASYKPSAKQLRERLLNIGLREVFLAEYPVLHMLAGLFECK